MAAAEASTRRRNGCAAATKAAATDGRATASEASAATNGRATAATCSGRCATAAARETGRRLREAGNGQHHGCNQRGDCRSGT